MVKWRLVYTRQAQKDASKLAAAGLKQKATELLEILETNPYQNPPPYEKLVGDLTGAYSRRINIHHRLVYQVLDAEDRQRDPAVVALRVGGSIMRPNYERCVIEMHRSFSFIPCPPSTPAGMSGRSACRGARATPR